MGISKIKRDNRKMSLWRVFLVQNKSFLLSRISCAARGMCEMSRSVRLVYNRISWQSSTSVSSSIPSRSLPHQATGTIPSSYPVELSTSATNVPDWRRQPGRRQCSSAGRHRGWIAGWSAAAAAARRDQCSAPPVLAILWTRLNLSLVSHPTYRLHAAVVPGFRCRNTQYGGIA